MHLNLRIHSFSLSASGFCVMQLFQVTGLCASAAIHQIKRENKKKEEKREIKRREKKSGVSCACKTLICVRLMN